MRKSPIKVKLQYFPPSPTLTEGAYKVVRIDGKAFVWHPAKKAERLHLGDTMDENEAEQLSTAYNVTTIL